MEQVARWVELAAAKVRQLDEPLKGGKQPREKGQAKAARELGISEPDARRAVKVAKLSDEAKAAARLTPISLAAERTPLSGRPGFATGCGETLRAASSIHRATCSIAFQRRQFGAVELAT